MRPAAEAGRVPPQNLEAERAVLGAILLKNKVVDGLLDVLEPDDFYRDGHRTIYSAAIELYHAGQPVDVVSLANHLETKGFIEKAGGYAYIAGLTDRVTSTVNVASHAKIIKEKAFYRLLIDEAALLIDDAYKGEEDIEQFLLSNLGKINTLAENKRSKTVWSIKEIAKICLAQIEENFRRKEPITGLRTQFAVLNKMTSGLQRSDLIIVAARPAMGKTAFCLNLASHLALREKKSVLIYSLEMSKEQLVQRVICSEAYIKMQNLRSGLLGEDDFQRLLGKLGDFGDARFFVDDRALKLSDIAMRARRTQREHGLDLVIIDYLQLIRLDSFMMKKSTNREQEIAEISRTLKELAKELSIPVITLSQLNRDVEKRTDKRPGLSDLRESGAIEQDADLIAFLYRDEYYNPDSPDQGLAELIIGKHRNGEIGKVVIEFKGEYALFQDRPMHGLDQFEA